ncbi:4-hydroxythreonine-4-phosphate dehydrogenase PdxA [Sneathiella chinensis]|uniref:4-hydroxythreonine-4-phosphate dehydrogenase n=1 Tax=Sneathiella chinensis TaxID=349750 RepID=A0ABQ5U8Q7_9PROT|nr:4-hydroxythreonine-4-phosphate dehydrogenase PdxA [Sneathiella chinensis]GLQ07570.1 4-hydroxythreonine-4-phosphate dehydrogenase [Sneathiella chinensis]
MNSIPPLAITMGDPAGIGMEITAKAWAQRHELGLAPFALIANPERVNARLAPLFPDLPIREIAHPAAAAEIFDSALPILSPATGGTAAEDTVAAIEYGVRLCQQGEVSALVTNPIQKKRLYDAGFTHPGHTEFLADLTGAPGKAVMMLACEALKVVPATIHIPLAKVSAALSAGHLEHVIRTTWADLTAKFGIAAPRLVVAGLNPHAGEDGSIGREEQDMIIPLVRKLKAEGLGVTGPFPADSLFHPAARAQYDAAICMYHDQALIPIKTIDFENGVNVTLGLPIIRTSPDHGTADDIAGKGIANPASLIAAIRMATDMARAQRTLPHD